MSKSPETKSNKNSDNLKKESNMPKLPEFIELAIQSAFEDARCVDGRNSSNSHKGPQFPGGSLFPILLKAVYTGSEFTESFVANEAKNMKENGIGLGVHDGSHKHDENSDCGFADKMKTIFNKALTAKGIILERLQNLVNNGVIDKSHYDAAVYAYSKMESYNPENISHTGASLIQTMVNQGAYKESVEHDHKEQIAFVNLKEGTTLDTNQLNESGQQAFNFDLWALPKITERMGVTDQKFIIGASLVAYAATEMVLVEDKGKPALPIAVHN